MLLPFTPPAGWTELPARAMATQITNTWQRAASRGMPPSTFTEMVAPFAFPASASAGQRASFCGFPGRVVMNTRTTPAGRTVTIMASVTRNGYNYFMVYVRPAQLPADQAIMSVVHGFCPPTNGHIATLDAPHGWQASGSITSLGAWMGNGPMQMMNLSSGPHMVNLADVARDTGANGSQAISLTSKPGTLCGLPAFFVTLAPNVPAMPVTIEQAITQNESASYMLTYMHPANAPADPAAEASLRSLCAKPVAAPTPLSATPSPAPSVSVLPRASSSQTP